jgi:hypothetical protein
LSDFCGGCFPGVEGFAKIFNTGHTNSLTMKAISRKAPAGRQMKKARMMTKLMGNAPRRSPGMRLTGHHQEKE